MRFGKHADGVWLKTKGDRHHNSGVVPKGVKDSSILYNDVLLAGGARIQRCLLPAKTFSHTASTMAILAPVLASACVASYVLYFFAKRIIAWKRLRHIPGPTEAAWSQSWLVRHQLGGDMCFDLEEVCNKHGTEQKQICTNTFAGKLC